MRLFGPDARCGDKLTTAFQRGIHFHSKQRCPAKSHQHIVEKCQQAGYRIAVHYVFVSDVELAIKRVANRVLLDGHDVPEADQRRRYGRSLQNANQLLQTCDEAFVYLNDTLEPHQLVAVYEKGKPIFKCMEANWLP